MKSIKNVSIIILLLLTVQVSPAQTVVKGILKDSLSNETISYASVKVYKDGEGKSPVTMSTTDANGCILQKIEGKGNYVVTVNYIGKKEVTRNLQLYGQIEVDLGMVLMTDDTKSLEDVEVVAQKPIVKLETDKVTYNVQEDDDSKTMTVLDMLRKIPMVVVDGEDNITVNGSTSYKIHVDGKPNQMLSGNASQILKMMPASMVNSIEVITNPGAKYDAEGSNAILNIVMYHEGGAQSEKSKDYTGNIGATIGNKGYSANASVNGQQGKLSYSGNTFLNYNKMKGSSFNINRTQVSGAGESYMRYMQKRSDIRQPMVFANANMGYDIDSLNVINVSLGFSFFRQKINGQPITDFTGGIYGDGFTYSNEMHQDTRNTGFYGSLDYQHYFNKDHSKVISFSYQFDTNPSHAEDYRIYQDVPANSILTLDNLYQDGRTRSTTQTVQVDYSTPVGEKGTINVGGKFINRRNTSEAGYYSLDENDNWAYDMGSSLKYRNTQSILAGYTEFCSTIGKCNSTIGLRYEHTWENITYITGNTDDFKKNYGCLVPSLSVGYSISPMMNIGLNYAMHILRPGIGYLNPYIDKSSPTALSYGNPDLDIEKSHNVGIVFNFYSQKFMMSMTLSQNICNDQIAEYSFMDEDNLLNTTYGNVVKNRWTNFNAFARWVMGKNTSVMFNGGIDYGDMRSDQLKQRNHGWQFRGYLGLQQTLPWQLKWSFGAFGKNRNYNIQGYSGSMNFLNTSISKSLFNDRLDLSLMYMTPFTGKLKIKSKTAGFGYVQNTRIEVPLQTIRFSVKWNFGNTKKRYQQRQSKIKNDFGDKQTDGQQLNNISSGNVM